MESRPGTTELSSLQHNNYSPTQCNHCEGHDTDDDSEQEEMSESTSNSLVCSPAASCQHTIERLYFFILKFQKFKDSVRNRADQFFPS